MGEVWLGQRDDGLFDQSVAIKLIQPHLQVRAGEAFDGDYDIVHAQDCISANAVPRCVRTIHHLDTFTTPELAAWHDRAIVTPLARICVSAAVAREAEQRGGVARSEADAAVARAAPEGARGIGAVDRVAAAEEHRVRHRRIVILVRAPHRGHQSDPEASVRRDVAAPRRGDRPVIGRGPVDEHAHALARLVDLRDDAGRRGCGERAGREPAEEGGSGELESGHVEPPGLT